METYKGTLRGVEIWLTADGRCVIATDSGPLEGVEYVRDAERGTWAARHHVPGELDAYAPLTLVKDGEIDGPLV